MIKKQIYFTTGDIFMFVFCSSSNKYICCFTFGSIQVFSGSHTYFCISENVFYRHWTLFCGWERNVNFCFSNQNPTIFIDVRWFLSFGSIHVNRYCCLVWFSGRIHMIDFGSECNGFILFDNYRKYILTSICSIQGTCVFPTLFVFVGIKQWKNICPIRKTHDTRCNVVWFVP